MASLLRTSKFFKYYSAASRGLSVSTSSSFKVSVQAPSILKSYGRDLATAAAQAESPNNVVEKYIKRFDMGVRKSGRISFKELQMVLDEIKISNQATSAQSLMLIRCCGNLIPDESPEVKLKLVEEIWNTLEKSGVPMDISHYNTLLLVYLENDHHFSPTQFLDNLSRQGIEPNRVTFQRLIASFCQQGNIEGATQILQFMKDKQMPISENIFNSLIIGHSQANDIQSAKGILDVMKQAGMEPSSETYTALLCAYAKYGDIDGITETFKAAEAKEVQFADRQLLEVIYSMAINNHSDFIDIVIPRLSRQAGYNQDAKNTILRLITRGFDDAAMRVFKTMTPPVANDEDSMYLGVFLLRQMVRVERPIEKILWLCEELRNSNMNERSLFYATESCLILGKTELGLKLISAIAKSEPVCQHYFWPALCQYGKRNDTDGIIGTLKQMSSLLNVPVPNETLRDYVVEYIGANEKGVSTLRQAGVTVASASSAIVAYHLGNNNLEAACKIASKYRANYNLVVIRRGIVQCYKTNPDLSSLITMVRCILSNINNNNNNGDVMESNENPDEVKPISDPAGSILLGIINRNFKLKTEEVEDILKGYLEYGIGISPKTAELIHDALSGESLTPEISTLLAKLTSSDLTFIPLERSVLIRGINYRKDESSLLEAIKTAEAQQQPTNSLKIQLLALYYKQEEYGKASQLMQELSDNKVEIPNDMLNLFLNNCIANENIDEATKFYQMIRSKPNSEISELTLVKLAHLYIEANRFDEAIKLFENHKSESYQEKEFSYSSTCWKLLNSVAEKGDGDKMDILFDTMRINNFIIPTNVLLGPLIKVHLVGNNMRRAFEKFEECCTLYRSTPWKNELACKLIQAEDAATLQKLTDLSSQVHGEVNSLYDLVLSFIECGRVRQARKILETPGLRTKHSRLSSACLRYQNEGHIIHLENLVEVTKDLPHIDRSDIYYHLLGSYCNSDDVDKAMGLWTQMQEEDVQPSDRFLFKLANLLKKHKRPVPFSTPTTVTTDRYYSIDKRSTESEQIRAFRKALYSKDIDEAIYLKQTIPDTDLQVRDRSTLIYQLINNGRLGECVKLMTQWLEIGLKPSVKTLNYLINTIAKTGDINSLEAIGNLLDNDLKKLTSYINRYTHCMAQAGKSEEALKKLESELEAADTPEKLAECVTTFPRGGIFSILNASPEYLPRVEQLCYKYKEKGFSEPLNVLWIHYLLNNDNEKAEKIWSTIKSLERIMYQPILKKASGERNLELAESLLKKCQEAKIKTLSLAPVYSCILDILVSLEKYDDCSARLDDTLKIIPIENINFQTLKRIKFALEEQGKEFKYALPIKKVRSIASSSSSDSDSEEEIARKA